MRTRKERSATPRPATPSRREFVLGTLGGVAATVLLPACGDGAGPGRNTCTVYPEETQGPYYLDLNLLRRDLTEGRPGTALKVMMQVVQATGCMPLPSLAVEIWHCDAGGVYSGFAGQLGGVDTTGQTFLRGTQVTGDDGRAQFDTIYPGWYPGRTTHIHFKVHLSSTRAATSQLYFPEGVTADVYQTTPYSTRGPKDTPNAGDGVFRSGAGSPGLLAITRSGAGYLGLITIAVAG